VSLEGYQADPYSYYPVFDVFVLTSNEEGLGSAILDAFFYGVPVVATAAGGIPEMVKPNETGLLCPIADDSAVANAILALLNDATLAKRLTLSARTMLESEFTVRKMAERYAAVYRELLSESRPRQSN
jgi:glycosyltransferase involved in cell wall biosynthesis